MIYNFDFNKNNENIPDFRYLNIFYYFKYHNQHHLKLNLEHL